MEFFFIFCINRIEDTGQILSFVIVRHAGHPSSIGLHIHPHIWAVMDVNLQISKLLLSDN